VQQLIPHYLGPRLWMVNQGRRRSACVEAKHALLKEVGAAGKSPGGCEPRRYAFRTVSHCHRFSHLRVQSRR
jgi:hypothetical protein